MRADLLLSRRVSFVAMESLSFAEQLSVRLALTAITLSSANLTTTTISFAIRFDSIPRTLPLGTIAIAAAFAIADVTTTVATAFPFTVQP